MPSRRSRWPPPWDWTNRYALPEDLQVILRDVRAFEAHEIQGMLQLYAHVGYIRNRSLEEDLRSGKLRVRVQLMTSGVGKDVFQLCDSM